MDVYEEALYDGVYTSLLIYFIRLLFQNITGVVAAISDLLSVKIPSSYEVSSTPDRGPRVGPQGMEPHAPMLYHGPRDNGGLHIRPGHMMRPGGGHELMQQQAHNFPFHLNRAGEKQLRLKLWRLFALLPALTSKRRVLWQV